MKLRYRGNFYDPSDPSIQTHDRPIKLIYRGHEFTYQPQPTLDLKQQPQQYYEHTVKLIYRGHTIDYRLPIPSQPQACVTNWRFAMAARQTA